MHQSLVRTSFWRISAFTALRPVLLVLLTVMIGAVPGYALMPLPVPTNPGVGRVEWVAASKNPYYTPARNTQLRKLLMDAARGPVSFELGQPVIFLVSVLRTDSDWAYLQAEPRNKDGSALDWSRTPFADDWAQDAMSDVIMVLMKKSGA